METMASHSEVHSQLLDRQARIREFLKGQRQSAQLVNLLREVDSALERIDDGSYGICEICSEGIEANYLQADPLVKICLAHLSEDQRHAVERDLERAAAVQGKLLPTTNKNFDGWEVCYHYEPLGPVSGDFCDLIQQADGSLFFIFGDVSGKGVAASLLMSHLHGIFRSLVSSEMAVHRLVEQANRLFTESTHSANFATLVFGKASANGEVELTNAGHCYPLAVQQGQIRSIESTGLPLGMFFSAEYESRKVHLAPGDTLFLYTDGFTEARSSTQDEYSEARLSALIAREHHRSPEDLIKSALADLTSFRNGIPKIDDITLLALKRRG
jgi:sigma-B regulation protein RsbU (phosphoserine phosphatase)